MVRLVRAATDRNPPSLGGGGCQNVTPNGGLYLTRKDYAAEFGLLSSCQLDGTLRLLVEANYMALWLDQSSNVWGGFHRNGRATPANSLEDAWNVNVSLVYRF